ncbi:MAG: threonine ammonia-lyase [Hyphomicrobiales bacterium]|nr:threonine ammonia-lyase [Hyphomicrobiales bacterium]
MTDTFTAADVRAAAAAIAGAVVRTKTAPSLTLSRLTGAQVFVKFENHQFTASFKERGALNRMLALTADERARGVVAMSAGNHAQGVACHAQRLEIAATIVMPRDTPNIKVRHTMDFGARVVLHGATLAEASAHAHALAAERGAVFIHPYDDPLVAAGQGTVGLEMLADVPDLEVLVVPIGGGGLIAGVATAAKDANPDIQVIGVQTRRYPGMVQALGGGEPAAGGGTIAEGIAVKEPGAMTRRVVADLVDHIALVDEPRIEQAICLYLMIEKTVAEGAGAAALAAVLDDPDRFRGRKVGLVLSGGNIDQRLLATVLMRDLVRQGRMARLRVTVSDTPGELAHVTRIIGEGGGNIVDVAHLRAFSHAPAKSAEVDFALETRDADQMEAIVTALTQAGYPVSRA